MKKSILLALLAMMWLVVPVRALEPGANTTTKKQIRPTVATSSAVKTAVENKCRHVESKIDFRLNFYEQNKDKHYQTFEKAKSGVNNLITKYQNRGCDVTKLKADVAQLESLIQAFAAAYRDFHANLQGTKSYACGNSQGQFVNALQIAKSKITAVQQAHQAVRTYYQQTVRPDFVAVAKSCKPSPKPSAHPAASPVTEGVK